ncbi:MAG: hypothetical protein Q9M92_10935, partial [Enterobacterales bacterium]|nr:hypothetical protein [Enterobacterales bacterium]
KQSGAKAIGIVATDVRDQLFLVNEIKRKMPNILVFTYEGDVLLTHPYYKKATRGLLVASSNRLEFNDSHTKSVRIFSSDRAIGVFNAFSEALNTTKKSTSSDSSKTKEVIITSPSNSGLWVLEATSSKPGDESPYIPSIWKIIFIFLIVATAFYSWNLYTRPKHHYNYANNERILISNKQKSISLRLYLSLAMIPFSISLLIINKSDVGMAIVIWSYWISQLVAIVYSNVSHFKESWNIVITSNSDHNWVIRYRKIISGLTIVIFKSIISLMAFWIILIFIIYYSFDIVDQITYDNYIRLLSLNSGLSPLLPLLLFSSVLTYYYSIRLADHKLQTATIYFSKNKMKDIPPVVLLSNYVNFSSRVLKLMIPIATTFILIPTYYIYNEYLGGNLQLLKGWDELPMPLAMFEVSQVTFWVNMIFILALFSLVVMSIKYMSNYDRLMEFTNSVRRFINIDKERSQSNESGFFEKIFSDSTPFMLGVIKYTTKDKEDMASWEDLKNSQGNIEILYEILDKQLNSEELIESLNEFRMSNSVDVDIASLTQFYCSKIREQLILRKTDQKAIDKECKGLNELVGYLIDKRQKLALELYILMSGDEFTPPKNMENGLARFYHSLKLDDQAVFEKSFFSYENMRNVSDFYSFLNQIEEPIGRVKKICELVTSIQQKENEIAQKIIEHAQKNDIEAIINFREECRNNFKASTIEWLKLLIPVLRRQLSFIIYASIAILLGVMSYPFYPYQFLLTWVGVIVILIAILSANSIVQMDRNYVLSALFTKSHEKVGINKSFANGIAKYSAAPISMVFLSQSEWLQNAIGDFLAPILNSIFS